MKLEQNGGGAAPHTPASLTDEIADVDPITSVGHAVLLNRTDVLNLLLRKHGAALGGEPLDMQDCVPGDTALHYACRLGRVDAVRALLRAGVPVDVRNERGELPFESRKGAPPDKVKAIDQAFVSEIVQNVCSGQSSRVKKLIAGGVPATTRDGSPDDASLLHWAASFGHGRSMITVLCEGGADPNARNKRGSTPAHEASSGGRLETLEALFELGADFSLKNAAGQTPKDLAKDADVVRFFGEHLPGSRAALLASPARPSAAAESAGAPPAPPAASAVSAARALFGGSASATNGSAASHAGGPAPSSAPQAASPAAAAGGASAAKTLNGGNGGNGGNGSSATSTLTTTGAASPAPGSAAGKEREEAKSLKARVEEQEQLIASLRNTIDVLLQEKSGGSEVVTRLREHVGALTRQLAATAEQRDKLSNLYVASDREVERLARELAALRASADGAAAMASLGKPEDLSGLEDEPADVLRARCRQLAEELERERKEAYAAARLHLTYEADLRAGIKSLQEQMLMHSVTEAQRRGAEEQSGVFSSFFPWFS